MSFVAGLLRRLFDDRQVTLANAASDVYTETLYQYHGWITSAAFTVALKVSQMLLNNAHQGMSHPLEITDNRPLHLQRCFSSRCDSKHCLSATQTFVILIFAYIGIRRDD